MFYPSATRRFGALHACLIAVTMSTLVVSLFAAKPQARIAARLLRNSDVDYSLLMATSAPPYAADTHTSATAARAAWLGPLGIGAESHPFDPDTTHADAIITLVLPAIGLDTARRMLPVALNAYPPLALASSDPVLRLTELWLAAGSDHAHADHDALYLIHHHGHAPHPRWVDQVCVLYPETRVHTIASSRLFVNAGRADSRTPSYKAGHDTAYTWDGTRFSSHTRTGTHAGLDPGAAASYLAQTLPEHVAAFGDGSLRMGNRVYDLAVPETAEWVALLGTYAQTLLEAVPVQVARAVALDKGEVGAPVLVTGVLDALVPVIRRFRYRAPGGVPVHVAEDAETVLRAIHTHLLRAVPNARFVAVAMPESAAHLTEPELERTHTILYHHLEEPRHFDAFVAALPSVHLVRTSEWQSKLLTTDLTAAMALSLSTERSTVAISDLVAQDGEPTTNELIIFHTFLWGSILLAGVAIVSFWLMATLPYSGTLKRLAALDHQD